MKTSEKWLLVGRGDEMGWDGSFSQMGKGVLSVGSTEHWKYCFSLDTIKSLMVCCLRFLQLIQEKAVKKK